MRTKILVKDSDYKFLINTLKRHRINVFKFCYDEGCKFEINKEDLNRLQRLLKKKKIEFIILEKGGVTSSFKKVSRYIGVPIGILIIMSMYLVFSMFSYGVNIVCDNESTKAEIQKLVNERIKFPYRIANQKDFDELEYEIISRFENVAFCEINKEKLKIKIEATIVGYNNVDSSKYAKVVSDNDAVITKVLVSSGTALVEVGDTIKKGDVLIAGYVEKKDNTEEHVDAHADGEVYGKVWYHSKLSLPKYKMEMISSGKETKSVKFLVFNKKMIQKSGESFLYSEEKICEYNLLSILPIKLVWSHKTELIPNIVEVSQEEIEERIANERSIILENIKDKGKVLDNWIIKKEMDNMTLLDIYYEVEECISVREEKL